MRTKPIHESQNSIAHPNDAFSRAKPAFKEKHVAVSGGFKICVLKYSNVQSCIRVAL